MPVFHSYAHNMACQVCSIKIYLIKVHCWLNLISQHTVLRILQSFTRNFEIEFKNKNCMCMFFLYTLHSIVSERIWLKFSIWKDISYWKSLALVVICNYWRVFEISVFEIAKFRSICILIIKMCLWFVTSDSVYIKIRLNLLNSA